MTRRTFVTNSVLRPFFQSNTGWNFFPKFGLTSIFFSDENVWACGRQINHLAKGHTQVTLVGIGTCNLPVTGHQPYQ